jgi:hypothetical protein
MEPRWNRTLGLWRLMITLQRRQKSPRLGLRRAGGPSFFPPVCEWEHQAKIMYQPRSYSCSTLGCFPTPAFLAGPSRVMPTYGPIYLPTVTLSVGSTVSAQVTTQTGRWYFSEMGKYNWECSIVGAVRYAASSYPPWYDGENTVRTLPMWLWGQKSIYKQGPWLVPSRLSMPPMQPSTKFKNLIEYTTLAATTAQQIAQTASVPFLGSTSALTLSILKCVEVSPLEHIHSGWKKKLNRQFIWTRINISKWLHKYMKFSAQFWNYILCPKPEGSFRRHCCMT